MAEAEKWQVVEASAPDRHARQKLIPGWNQDLLRSSSVVVVGAGAVGNEALSKLVLLGVGRIVVVDMDVIECSNLARTVLFRERDIGRNKAEVACECMVDIDPAIRAEPICEAVEWGLGCGVVAEAGVVLSCVDNLAARVHVNRLCLRAGVPLVDAGIDAFSAAVHVITPAAGGCYECALPASARQRLAARRSCADGLIRAAARREVPTTATMAAMAAAMQVQEAVALLHASAGLTEIPLAASAGGTRHLLGSTPWSLRSIAVRRSERCTAHELWKPKPVAASVATTLSELAEMTGAEAVLLDHDVVLSFTCQRCAKTAAHGRPVERTQRHHLQCGCGGTREATVAREVGLRGDLSASPLADVGVAPAAWLALRHNGGRIEHIELVG